MPVKSFIPHTRGTHRVPAFSDARAFAPNGWVKISTLAAAALLLVSSGLGWASDFKLLQDVPYLGPERAEKMDIYLPQGATEKVPAVLYIHGGGWTQGDKAQGIEKLNCQSLVKLGYAVASINYKLNTKGTADAYPQNIRDCKSALQYLRKEAGTYGLDPDRIGVAGASAGGHLAMLVAYTPKVDELQHGTLYPDVPIHVSCVITLFGIADVRKWGRRSFVQGMNHPAEQAKILELVSPITHVNSETVPTLIIHGTKDPTVPFSQAEALASIMTESNVSHRFVAVENGEHAFPLTPHQRNVQADLVPVVAEFLSEHLQRKTE